MENGILKGELCGRDGCDGIIDEHDTDGGCSCHINPPCSYCVTDRAYCPKCGYDGGEEQKESNQINTSYKGFGSKQMHDDYYKWKDANDKFQSDFAEMYSGNKPAEKLIIISETHTHFSMIKKGVFPLKTETMESLLPQVRGTFGGRFTHFNEFSFKYVAYTD